MQRIQERTFEGQRIRKRLAGLTVAATLIAMACFAGSPRALPDGVVSKIPGDGRPLSISKMELSEDKTQATVSFVSSLGIFAFAYQPGDLPLKTMTFVVENQNYCEGLTFHPKSGKEIDLRNAEGVRVAATNGTVRIEVRAPALETMKPGGRIQYVNQYR
jgi:hypothetical protein